MIDRLRELLLPALALSILGTLWAMAEVRNAEEDLLRGLPPAPLALMRKAEFAALEPEPAAAEPAGTSAQADASHLDP